MQSINLENAKILILWIFLGKYIAFSFGNQLVQASFLTILFL